MEQRFSIHPLIVHVFSSFLELAKHNIKWRELLQKAFWRCVSRRFRLLPNATHFHKGIPLYVRGKSTEINTDKHFSWSYSFFFFILPLMPGS